MIMDSVYLPFSLSCITPNIKARNQQKKAVLTVGEVVSTIWEEKGECDKSPSGDASAEYNEEYSEEEDGRRRSTERDSERRGGDRRRKNERKF